MPDKVLVANRGEIAVRVLRTCRELGLRTVAVFSEADRGAPHVRYADEAYCIGPPPAVQSYLRGDRILDAAQRSGARFVHPGYGFLAASATLAQDCADAGLTFIGPRPATLELLVDRLVARDVACQLGIPVAEVSEVGLDDEQLLAAADGMGYPVMLKPVAAGGPVGISAAQSAEELKAAIRDARKRVRDDSADPGLYIERLVEDARHIEVQLLGDLYGHVIHLGERECSIQHRHQTLIEEAPSRALDESLRGRIHRAAVRIGEALDYVGAGTVEFLLDPEGRFTFLEVDPRLKVAHTVTEAITGVDIVKEQIRIAAGRELQYARSDVESRGWALECRVLAEDPDKGFAPCVGTISRLRVPGGPGIRVDSGIAEGLEITAHYDPLLAKLIAWGETRGVAIVRMRRALEEYHIGGVTTNLRLYRALMDSTRFLGGQFHTGFVEEKLRGAGTEGGNGVPTNWAADADRRMAAALAAALDDHRQRRTEQSRPDRTSHWKMLGRWHLQNHRE
ncbi:MAG: biotin carboxylase N-terminal domain-containing protein [Anaerolineae bacterium]|jgi:acetyl/propionyl-CoA carboxylase alpha subunit